MPVLVTCPKCHGLGKVDRLTDRELEVMLLLARGKTPKDVAVILSLALKTVQVHQHGIYRKLGLHSQIEVIKYALKFGYLTQKEFV